MEKNILQIDDLSISFKTGNQKNKVVHGISYELFHDEILGIVGESGSGKSVSTLAILGLLPSKQTEIRGAITFKGQNLLQLQRKELALVRGNKISMIFQEPMSSLNPSLRCGFQVMEILKIHTSLPDTEAKEEILNLFEKVRLPHPERVFESYPHQLSGGQKQRVMIAMAIACKPDILIADEPTTALDVTVQKEIIALLKHLQKETGMSIIFISHDLSLVSEIANRILVMYQGHIVEQGDTRRVFKNAKHSYTKALLSARPSMEFRLKTLPTIQHILDGTFAPIEYTSEERMSHHQKLYSKQPLLRVVNVKKEYISRSALFGKSRKVLAVNDVSFNLFEGETLGLVGESGCGKSTLGNAILQLNRATSGSIYYRGKDITKISNKELRDLRKEIQIIFQDPFASLNPRIPVGKAIMEPMKVHGLYENASERKERTLDLLEQVGLDASCFNRYPHEFSGGQRQRIGIARTIAVQPKLIICDESVSALDISVQAQVLNLLNELKERFKFTYIFISHDLAVVKYMADQLVVMNQGRIEESGDADIIYETPKSAYTRQLMNAVPKGIKA